MSVGDERAHRGLHTRTIAHLFPLLLPASVTQLLRLGSGLTTLMASISENRTLLAGTTGRCCTTCRYIQKYRCFVSTSVPAFDSATQNTREHDHQWP